MKWIKKTIWEFEKEGNYDLRGHIIEFDPPLYITGFDEPIEKKDSTEYSYMPSVRTKKPVGRFMKVSDGFGSNLKLMGRLITGTYYATLKDVENDDPIELEGFDVSKGTKEHPSFIHIVGGQCKKKPKNAGNKSR